MPDGYLYTYNQIHFPGQRWVNPADRARAVLPRPPDRGRRLAPSRDRRAAPAGTCPQGCRPAGARASWTPARSTPPATRRSSSPCCAVPRHRRGNYLELARHSSNAAGASLFPLHHLSQNKIPTTSASEMSRTARRLHRGHPEHADFGLPPGNPSKTPPFAGIQRWMLNALSGKYFQQHAPIRRQTVPVGHTRPLRLPRDRGRHAGAARRTTSAAPALEKAWERMVTRRMYVTGGMGALPFIEGFGRDYELDPEICLRRDLRRPRQPVLELRDGAAHRHGRATTTCSSGSSTTPPRSASAWTGAPTFTTTRSPAAAA